MLYEKSTVTIKITFVEIFNRLLFLNELMSFRPRIACLHFVDTT